MQRLTDICDLAEDILPGVEDEVHPDHLPGHVAAGPVQQQLTSRHRSREQEANFRVVLKLEGADG
jgi:hypothetical protein